MQRPPFARYRRRKGVSEVLGALLLIVVVVAAVASLSVFLSQATTNAENRQNYITSVQNEDLQFAYAQFSPSNPNIHWELDEHQSDTAAAVPPPTTTVIETSGTYVAGQLVGLTIRFGPGSSASPVTDTVASNTANSITFATALAVPPSVGDSFTLSGRYYVIMVDQTHITLTEQNSSTSASAMLIAGTFQNIAKDVTTTYVPGSPGTITFGAGIATFEPATWSNATITIRNLNTAASGLYQLSIGGNWMTAWKQVTQAGVLIYDYGATKTALTIPARGTVTILVDFSGLSSVNFPKNQSVELKILSSAGNLFSTDITQPVAVAKVSTTTENYQITNRDIISFDASQSFSSDATIEQYQWTISVPLEPACSIASFSSPSSYVTAYVTGETVQFTPESLYPGGVLTDCFTGPVKATLTVVDDNGFLASSQSIILPQDPNIAPASELTVSGGPTCVAPTGTVTVTVLNIFGQPIDGVPVVAFPSSGVAITSQTELISGSPGPGQAQFTYTCPTSGTIEFTSGTLPPLFSTVS